MVVIRDVSKRFCIVRVTLARYVHLTAKTLLIIACTVASSASLAGNLDRIVRFNIDARTLGKALLQFGAQAHVQISFAWNSSTAKLHTHQLKGNYTGREALSQLLEGTPLRYVAHKETVAILPINSVRQRALAPSDQPGKATFHVESE